MLFDFHLQNRISDFSIKHGLQFKSNPGFMEVLFCMFLFKNFEGFAKCYPPIQC